MAQGMVKNVRVIENIPRIAMKLGISVWNRFFCNHIINKDILGLEKFKFFFKDSKSTTIIVFVGIRLNIRRSPQPHATRHVLVIQLKFVAQ